MAVFWFQNFKNIPSIKAQIIRMCQGIFQTLPNAYFPSNWELAAPTERQGSTEGHCVGLRSWHATCILCLRICIYKTVTILMRTNSQRCWARRHELMPRKHIDCHLVPRRHSIGICSLYHIKETAHSECSKPLAQS